MKNFENEMSSPSSSTTKHTIDEPSHISLRKFHTGLPTSSGFFSSTHFPLREDDYNFYQGGITSASKVG